MRLRGEGKGLNGLNIVGLDLTAYVAAGLKVPSFRRFENAQVG